MRVQKRSTQRRINEDGKDEQDFSTEREEARREEGREAGRKGGHWKVMKMGEWDSKAKKCC